WVELAVRQITAIYGNLSRLAGFDHGRIDRIDPGSGADAEPVKILAAALSVRELIQPDVVVGVGRQRAIQQGVVILIMPVESQSFAGAVIQLDAGLQAAIDR